MNQSLEQFCKFENIFEHQNSPLATKLRIGLVQLATDFTLERDWHQLTGKDIELYTARMFSEPEMSLESLPILKNHIAAAVELLVPGKDLDVVAFGCTSASMLIGEQGVEAQFARSRPDVPCTNPWIAAKAALLHLGAKKVAVLTPYCSEINFALCQGLEEADFDVSAFGTFNLAQDIEVPNISPAALSSSIQRLLTGVHADAVFLSCTNMRALEVVGELEQRFKLPIVSSNQALFWHALRLAGSDLRVNGFGRLLAER